MTNEKCANNSLKNKKYKLKPIESKGEWLIDKFDRIEKDLNKISCKSASKLSLKQKEYCVKMAKQCKMKLIEVINNINKPLDCK